MAPGDPEALPALRGEGLVKIGKGRRRNLIKSRLPLTKPNPGKPRDSWNQDQMQAELSSVLTSYMLPVLADR